MIFRLIIIDLIYDIMLSYHMVCVIIFNRFVIISMEALDQLLLACHAQTLNLFVESFLKMVQKLLECPEPDLQILATQSVGLKKCLTDINRKYILFKCLKNIIIQCARLLRLRFINFLFCFILQFVKFANIEEDTPSYHRGYDFFVSKFSSMCHNNDGQVDVRQR